MASKDGVGQRQPNGELGYLFKGWDYLWNHVGSQTEASCLAKMGLGWGTGAGDGE